MEQTAKISPKEELINSLDEKNAGILRDTVVGKRAVDEIRQLEFPTTRTEAWKYTRTTRLQNEKWKVEAGKSVESISDFVIPGLDCFHFVFVNGFFKSELSESNVIAGVKVTDAKNNSGKELLSFDGIENDIFSALNTGFCTDGLALNVEANVVVSKPVHFVFIQNDDLALAQPRIHVGLETGSKAEIIVSYHSSGDHKCFTNAAFNAEVKPNASLTWTKLQLENNLSFNITREFVHQHKDSVVNFNSIHIDGAWVRNDLRISLAGTNCETHLSGVYMPREQQFVDNHTVVDHLMPNCVSNELYKGVVFDSAKAVFNGKVFVRPDAQKTNAFQSNANIVASDQAAVYSKPELEIYADDVKCSHGSTTGQLDEEAMFYLRTRGLSIESARNLLVAAFINDVLNKIENDLIREYVIREFNKRNLLVM